MAIGEMIEPGRLMETGRITGELADALKDPAIFELYRKPFLSISLKVLTLRRE